MKFSKGDMVSIKDRMKGTTGSMDPNNIANNNTFIFIKGAIKNSLCNQNSNATRSGTGPSRIRGFGGRYEQEDRMVAESLTLLKSCPICDGFHSESDYLCRKCRYGV